MTTSYHFIEHGHKIVGRTGFEQVTTSVSVQGAWLPGATNLPWAEVAVSPGEQAAIGDITQALGGDGTG